MQAPHAPVISDPFMSRTEPSAKAGYAQNGLDRKAEWREDESRLAALKGNATKMIVFSADRPVLTAAPNFVPTMSLDAARLLGASPDVFLGMEGSTPFFSGFTRLDGEALKAQGFLAIDLRSIAVQGLVSAADLAILGQAKGLLTWHATHPFCARCGAKSMMVAAGYRRDCPECRASHFPRTDPVAIMMVVRGDSCLLARKSAFLPGMYSCLAGFIEPGETLEDAVRREVFEEAGVRAGRVTYHAAQPWPLPFSQLMMGCLAETTDVVITLDASELEAGRWFPREECRHLIDNTHPQGLFCPPASSIAHLLLRDWLEGLLS